MFCKFLATDQCVLFYQGGQGKYPTTPSPQNNRAVARFLVEKAFVPEEVANATLAKSVANAMQGLTRLQGCQLWNHAKDLTGKSLTKEQASHAQVLKRLRAVCGAHLENILSYSSESACQATKNCAVQSFFSNIQDIYLQHILLALN